MFDFDDFHGPQTRDAQPIHTARFTIDFDGSKHAPAMWSLEKSIDFGRSWSVWQHFVKDADNCELLGVSSSNEVSYGGCSSQSYGKNQRIVVDLMEMQLLNSNDGILEASEDWPRATSIRLHFYEWKINIKPLGKSKLSKSVSSHVHFGLLHHSKPKPFIHFSISMR